MRKICIGCNYIGNEIRAKYLHIIVPLILIFIGLEYLFTFFNLSPIYAIASILWLGFGIYSLKVFLETPDQCPNCKKSRTMIPLDTPRAQAIIQEHNLTVTLPETTPNLK